MYERDVSGSLASMSTPSMPCGDPVRETASFRSMVPLEAIEHPFDFAEVESFSDRDVDEFADECEFSGPSMRLRRTLTCTLSLKSNELRK